MIRFPIFLAALVFAAPAAGFDGLWCDLAIVPSDPTFEQPAFFYVAPDRTLPIQATVTMTNNQPMLEAMIDPGPPYGLTGVDFSKVYGIFDTGVAPDQVAIINGMPGFAADAAATLEGRDFAITTQDGFTVASKGDDRAMNFNDRPFREPFSGTLGKSYRLAIADDFAILSFSTGQMAELTAVLATPETCDSCEPWRDILDAIHAAAGPDAVLEAASGYSVAALVASRAEGAAPPTAVPPYLLAMFAVTRDTDHHPTLYLALLFPDAKTAQVGAKAAASGMQALLDEADGDGSPLDGGIATPTVDGAVATVQMTFDAQTGAVLGYSRLVQMVLNRSFSLLSPG